MNLPTIKQLMREQARFTHYEDGKLWYQVLYSTDVRKKDVNGDGYNVPSVFDFPVPVDAAAGAKFLNSDRAVFFMHWMRKHIEFLQAAHDQAFGTGAP